jgi:cysteinyl-tRNA synthetase
MAMRYLGETLDLHGGGEDLVFPHHECEVAQSEAVTGKPFARYWVHNGMVNLGAEKMSKSVGNVLTIRSLLARHDADAIRLYLLQTHYRRQVDFSEERLREQVKPLERLRGLGDEAARLSPTAPASDPDLAARIGEARVVFEAAMDDDFNTPQALAALFDLSSALYGYLDPVRRGERPARPFTEGVAELETLTAVLGFGPLGYAFRRAGVPPAPWERLIEEREAARRARDWARADAIRAELEAQGIVLEDTPAGTRWKRRPGPDG